MILKFRRIRNKRTEIIPSIRKIRKSLEVGGDEKLRVWQQGYEVTDSTREWLKIQGLELGNISSSGYLL